MAKSLPKLSQRKIARAAEAAGRVAKKDDAVFLQAFRAAALGESDTPRKGGARTRATARSAKRPTRRPGSRHLEADSRQLSNARKLATDVQHGVARILGGALVQGRSFPDCVAVGDSQEWDCTGTLIRPDVVITAGHCAGSATQVFVGNNVDKPGKVVKVAKRVRHPQYTRGHRNDLLVLLLAQKITNVPPRPIASAALIERAKHGRLVGFGDTDAEGTYGYGAKRLVDVPIASASCTGKVNGQTDTAAYGCYPNKEIVAGKALLQKDSCSGDSGGPLYLLDAKGTWRLGGVTSRSVDGATHVCGDGGVYVRIDKYVDWINSVASAPVRKRSTAATGRTRKSGRSRKRR